MNSMRRWEGKDRYGWGKMRINIREIIGVWVLLFLIVTAGQGEDIMEWSGSFGDIALSSITSKDDVRTGSSTLSLATNGEVEISADVSSAQLTNTTGGSSDTLITEYKLSFDGDGSSNTGAAGTAYQNYDVFLSTPVTVTHILGDDEVDVTLSVRVQNPPGELADAGDYAATITLTSHWTGP